MLACVRKALAFPTVKESGWSGTASLTVKKVCRQPGFDTRVAVETFAGAASWGVPDPYATFTGQGSLLTLAKAPEVGGSAVFWTFATLQSDELGLGGNGVTC